MMFAWWIVSQGPSTEYPPRCTIASTPLVIFIASANFEMSARRNCSSFDGFRLLLSESRSLYFPASSLRRCDPTSPAAPVMSTVFMDRSSLRLLSKPAKITWRHRVQLDYHDGTVHSHPGPAPAPAPYRTRI